MNSIQTLADLSDEEVDRICSGLKQNAAKVRYLRGLGLMVERRPNGRPLVARSEWDRRLSRMTDNAAQSPGLAPHWTN